MSKKDLSEQDIRSKFITPAILQSGWDLQTQIREERTFTTMSIIARGKARPYQTQQHCEKLNRRLLVA